MDTILSPNTKMTVDGYEVYYGRYDQAVFRSISFEELEEMIDEEIGVYPEFDYTVFIAVKDGKLIEYADEDQKNIMDEFLAQHPLAAFKTPVQDSVNELEVYGDTLYYKDDSGNLRLMGSSYDTMRDDIIDYFGIDSDELREFDELIADPHSYVLYYDNKDDFDFMVFASFLAMRRVAESYHQKMTSNISDSKRIKDSLDIAHQLYSSIDKDSIYDLYRNGFIELSIPNNIDVASLIEEVKERIEDLWGEPEVNFKYPELRLMFRVEGNKLKIIVY